MSWPILPSTPHSSASSVPRRTKRSRDTCQEAGAASGPARRPAAAPPTGCARSGCPATTACRPARRTAAPMHPAALPAGGDGCAAADPASPPVPGQPDGGIGLQPVTAGQHRLLMVLDQLHQGRAHPLQHVLQPAAGFLALHGQHRIHQVLMAGPVMQVPGRVGCAAVDQFRQRLQKRNGQRAGHPGSRISRDGSKRPPPMSCTGASLAAGSPSS